MKQFRWHDKRRYTDKHEAYADFLFPRGIKDVLLVSIM